MTPPLFKCPQCGLLSGRPETLSNSDRSFRQFTYPCQLRHLIAGKNLGGPSSFQHNSSLLPTSTFVPQQPDQQNFVLVILFSPSQPVSCHILFSFATVLSFILLLSPLFALFDPTASQPIVSTTARPGSLFRPRVEIPITPFTSFGP